MMFVSRMITAAMFKTDTAGRRIFFPRGAGTSGVVVPDAETETRLQRAVALPSLAAGAIVAALLIGAIATLGEPSTWSWVVWISLLVVVALVSMAGHFVARRRVGVLARSLEPTSETMSRAEQYMQQATAGPRWLQWYLVLAAPLLGAAMVHYGLGVSGGARVMAFAGAALMLLAFGQGVLGFIARRRRGEGRAGPERSA